MNKEEYFELMFDREISNPEDELLAEEIYADAQDFIAKFLTSEQ